MYIQVQVSMETGITKFFKHRTVCFLDMKRKSIKNIVDNNLVWRPTSIIAAFRRQRQELCGFRARLYIGFSANQGYTVRP